MNADVCAAWRERIDDILRFGDSKMGYAFTLDLPDVVYVSLLQQAQQTGKTPEEAVLDWLTSPIQAFHQGTRPLSL